ncbi:MAG: hypothetical protein KDA25_12365 [Phycisphaerales bacterium]|nr:hypothetical protein [Phycisphaerales bacterium]
MGAVPRIAAVVGLDHSPPAAAACVRDMLDRLRPPGDDDGTLDVASADGMAIGVLHGTLARSRCGRWIVALDGDLLDDVRADDVLERLVSSDAAPEVWLASLDGDFALAVLDMHAGRLVLARDRFGVRPLYHATRGRAHACASRPSGLVPVIGGLDPDPDAVARLAASHYRVFELAPDASPYRGVYSVPLASYVVHGERSGSPRPYWTLAPGADHDADFDTLAETYRDLLLRAVERRLGGGRAFTLSGGMDSSSVLSCAVHLTGAPQAAFSATYRGSVYDESDDIRCILDAAVSDWHAIEVDDRDLVDRIDAMIAMHDEPVATATWLAHATLCAHVARAGYDILLGGLGGDELNAGEYEYFPFFFADLDAAGDDATLAREIDAWVRHHDHPIFRKSRAVVDRSLATLVDRQRPGACRPDRGRIRRYADVLLPDRAAALEVVPSLDAPFSSYLRNRTWQDLTRETLPCCLRAQDRHGAAHGIRHRNPFLDRALVEFMYRVPNTMKIRDGVTKVLLRRAMRGILEERTRTRVTKTGWNAPADQWFAGRGRARLLDLVNDTGFRGRDLYDLDVLRRRIDEHDDIITNGRIAEHHMMLLWQVVNVDRWLRWADAQTTSDVAAGAIA